MRARCLSLVMAPLKLFFGDAKCIPNIKMLFVAFDFLFCMKVLLIYNLLQYSRLENPMDRGACRVTVYR